LLSARTQSHSEHTALRAILTAQSEAHQRFAAESEPVLLEIATAIVECLRSSGKLLLCGNGGSAADAQHVAAELVGRFAREREGWPAIALTTDTSILTAVGNDYGFDRIFARQVEALARRGDLVCGISTSGNSPNILAALEAAKSCGARTLGFTGGSGGKMTTLCDLVFIAPADNTARIQELHICAWHAICDLVEAGMMGSK